jgi:poly-beta-1,6-N-acetyl-D-glucosamine synthase
VLRYAVITPARDEEQNIPILADSLATQTVLPTSWIIVENGSSDGTAAVGRELEARYPWIKLVEQHTSGPVARGGPVARAFHAGMEALDQEVDVVVKLDADVSMGSDYFRQILEAFEADPSLGMTSGTLLEEPTEGRERFLAGDNVWGANRAYRRECLADVLPLEERMGWDTVDALKALACGWKVRLVRSAVFRHHRVEASRDRTRSAAWRSQGGMAWFVGYRPLYLIAKVSFRSVKDPAALSMFSGYVTAAVRREARLDDKAAMAVLRDRQRVRELPLRLSEALGRRWR